MKTLRNGALHPDVERVLIDESRLKERIRELGAEISRDYAGRDLTLVGILKGSVIFLSELLKSITIDCAVDFMSVSSYSGHNSTGIVRLLLDLRQNPEGKHLLIVDDIVDTGLTLSYLLENLKTRKIKTLEICAMLDKVDARRVPVRAKYVGFKIPSEFVVGFGLDYNERYRNIPYIGVLKKSAYSETPES